MQNNAMSYWQFCGAIVVVLVHLAKAGSSSLLANAAELLLDVLCAISLRIVDKVFSKTAIFLQMPLYCCWKHSSSHGENDRNDSWNTTSASDMCSNLD